MIGMVDIEFIKKKHFQEGWSIRHLAKVLAINRITLWRRQRFRDTD